MPLYVLAMPIGHIDDISMRALETLRQADMVLAEDTLKSGKLLRAYGIKANLHRCDAHTEDKATMNSTMNRKMEGILKQEGSVVLITDAGSPTVCDPGRKLVAHLHANKVPVIPIPGASASVAALSASGFEGDAFSFAGYPPRKSAARLDYFEKLKARGDTIVFYEAARRLASCLEDMSRVFGKERPVFLAHDMTKTYESFFYGNLGQLIKKIESGIQGEITLVVKGEKEDALRRDGIDLGEEVLPRLLMELTPRKAAAIAAELGNKSKNHYYRQALEIKQRQNTL